ncbi:MAG: cytidylate kinase-like family protein [Lachnospiraceae bacterium]|nr:cytidylate kinase-like family protein [Lachnospiraceae bacterium]
MDRHMIISVGCEYASGGVEIGKIIAEDLGLEYFDRDLIDQIITRVGISQNLLDLADAGAYVKGKNAVNPGYGGPVKYTDLTDRLVFVQKEIVKKLADRYSCVIIGRCADYILKDRHDVLNVFVYAPLEDRIKRTMEFTGCGRDEAIKLISDNDEMYHARYKQITDTFRGDRHNRHILIDSSLLGIKGTAGYIEHLVSLVTGE